MSNPNQHRAFFRHNHDHCIDSALQKAVSICQERRLKLTAIREQVLTIVWQSHRPLGAYAILDELAEQNTRRPAPPTVYRALEFLLEQGLIHRIASLNAYIGCCSPSKAHHSHFLICRHCDSAVELAAEPISRAIKSAANDSGFAVETETVEVIGLCPRCQQP
jgi:Fur family zinc uptake transcriptional regulator